MNLPKCKGPSQVLPILGILFDAIQQRVSLPPDKQGKYLRKVSEALETLIVTSKQIEKLIGYLSFASYVAPFGRPFLSALTSEIVRSEPRAAVCLSKFSILALKIWQLLLRKNHGISYNFVLGRLPHCPEEIFTDASSSWGIGGFYGHDYFQYSNDDIRAFHQMYAKCP